MMSERRRRLDRLATGVIVAVTTVALLPVEAVASETAAPRPIAELEVHGGVSIPIGVRGEVGAGPLVGGVLLWRPISTWAFGAMIDYAPLPWNASTHDFSAPDATVYTGLAGVAVRFYPVRTGWAEPYAQLAGGPAIFDASVQSTQSGTSAGGAIQAALGFDVYFTRAARFTGSLAGTMAFSATGGTEEYIPHDPPSPPIVSLAVGLRAGVTFGAAGGPTRNSE